MELQQFSPVHAHWPEWKATTGPVHYEGSRCSNEIRINVRLTLHMREMGWGGGSPCSSFILPSIYQCHSVNYCFIYLVTRIQPEYKLAPLPLCWKGKWLLSRLMLPTTGEREWVTYCQPHTVGFCSTTNRSSVLMSMRLDHAVPGSSMSPPPPLQTPICGPT